MLDDLSSGFYGALLDYKSGIVPRMRISAHIKVYNDTGHLIALDPHGEFPLEYLTAFFIAKISNINYILVYWYIIRLVNITLWLTLFLITYKYLKSQGASCIWQLVNICTLLMSSQTGYNYEVGLAMPFFLLLFLIGTKRGKTSSISALLIAAGIVMTSFNMGTVDLALVSLVGLSLYGISKFILHQFKPIEEMQCISTPIYALLILALTRIVIITTISYFGGYLTTFLSIINSFIRVMLEGPEFVRNPLVPFSRMPKEPVDTLLAYMSSYSFGGTFVTLLLLSVGGLYVSWRRKFLLRPFNLGILGAYIATSLLAGVTYVLWKAGIVIDYVSLMSFTRSLTSLVVLSTFSILIDAQLNYKIPKILRVGILVFTIFMALFTPLGLTASSSVKSVYDMLRVKGNYNEMIIKANNGYRFTVPRTIAGAEVAIDQSMKLYYMLVAKYDLGARFVGVLNGLTGDSVFRVFDNGMYVVMVRDDITIITCAFE
jgi:hypothetical protein